MCYPAYRMHPDGSTQIRSLLYDTSDVGIGTVSFSKKRLGILNVVEVMSPVKTKVKPLTTQTIHSTKVLVIKINSKVTRVVMASTVNRVFGGSIPPFGATFMRYTAWFKRQLLRSENSDQDHGS